MSFIFDKLFGAKENHSRNSLVNRGGLGKNESNLWARTASRRLHLESLEERTLLAVWLVDELTDLGHTVGAATADYAGTGELRAVLAAAASDDTIKFDPAVFTGDNSTIKLSGTELTVDKAITLDASANRAAGVNVTIDANGANRIFNISDGENIKSCDVYLKNLNLSNGNSTNGGAISNEESLTLQDVTITSCNATNGGAVYNLEYGTLSIEDSDFNTNTATANGGAIYNIGKTLEITNSSFTANTAGLDGGVLSLGAVADCNAVVTIRDSYFIRNQATGSGGAIHIGNEIDGTLDLALINSVIHSNTAANGGGIYNNGDSVKTTVVDSTVSLNTTSAAVGGSQIVNNKGKFYLINDVVIGTADAETVEIFNENTGSFYLYGSITGESSSVSAITQWGLITGAKAKDIFVSTAATQTDLQIKANGVADINGTLSGNICTFGPNRGNGDFYYLRNNTWYKAGDDTVTKPFDSANSDGNYGLGSNDDFDAIKEAYTIALNVDEYGSPVSRILLMNYNLYNAGAYVINRESEGLERPSIVVTTTADVFDMYDGKISLREAISYAGTGSLGSTITFDAAVFATIQTITLGSTLKINKDLTIDGAGKVILDGGNTFTSGVSNNDGIQIMYIAKYETVALNGLTLQNGYSKDGGAVYNYGKLTVTNCTFSGNSANRGGAVYLYGVNKVAFSAANCTFSGNSAEERGAAIYCYSYTYSWLTNCLVLDEVAVGSSNIDLYYCVYNTVLSTWGTSANCLSGKTADEVLESTALNADGTFHIKTDGVAAYSGTKLQNDGNGNLQYWDKNAATPTWVNAGTTTPFTTAQLQVDQVGHNRLMNESSGYSFGAYSAVGEPKSLTVTTAEDIVDPYDCLISLREAISYAGTDGLESDITFDSTVFATQQTITLDSTLGTLTIDKDLTIDGAGKVILDGGNAVQIMFITQGNTVALNGLTLQNGYNNDGGAVRNYGTLTVANSTFTGNSATGNGGAIFNYGALTAVNCTFSGNSATDNGGAIFNLNNGTLYMVNNLVVGNGNNQIENQGTFATDKYNITTGNVSDIFAEVSDGKATLHADGTFRIKANGIAAYSGTLVALKDGMYYFKDGAIWRKVTDPTVTSDGTGLTTITDDQNHTNVRNSDTAASYGVYAVGASFVEAATETKSLTVNTTADILNPYDNKISLRDAIAYAGTGGLGYTITFDSTVFATPQTITLGSTLNIDKNLSIDGAGKVILDGGDTWNGTTITTHSGVRIMSISSSKVVTLSNFTVQNAYTTTHGSAMTNSGTLTVDHLTFIHNTNDTATINGGVIWNDGTGILNVSNSLFDGNKAGNNGGAMINFGTMTVSNSTFSENTAANNGGAIANYKILTVSNSTFSNNIANVYTSGAILNGTGGTLTINNSTFSGNTAMTNGGAIYNMGNSLSVLNSTFSGNSANSGGAISHSGGNAYLGNCILVGNTATSSADIVTANNTLAAYYCLVGSVSGTLGNNKGTTTGITTDIFESTTLNTDGTFHIKATGVAANSGTLVAKHNTDGTYYFKDGDAWKLVSAPTTTAEESDLTIIDKDQLGTSRLGTVATQYDVYAAGASFVEAAAETPSTVVTTTKDVVNPYDGLISLREAVEVYSVAGDTITFTGDNGTQTVNSAVKVNKNITIGDDFTLSANNESNDLLVAANNTENITFGNVTILNGNVNMGEGSIIIATDKTLTIGSTTPGSTFTTFTSKVFTNNGTVDVAGVWDCSASSFGKVTYSGLTDQNVLSGIYDALTISGSGDKTALERVSVATLNINNGSKLVLNEDLHVIVAIDNDGTISLSGNFNYSGVAPDFGNITYAGGDQTVTAGTYDDLTLSGNGTKTLGGNVTAGNFKIDGTSSNVTTLDGDNKTLTVNAAGNFSAEYAIINNVNFANATTIDSWDITFLTNTVNGSGNTNLTINLGGTFTASVDNNLIYGQTLKDEAYIQIMHLLRGQNATLNGSTDNDTIYNAGTQTADVEVSAVGYTFSGNAAFTQAALTFTVNAKEVTVDWTGDTDTYTYNGADQGDDVSATYTDINNNEVDLTVVFSGQGTTFKSVGDYTAAASMTTSDANYTLTGATRDLTMNRKKLTVSGIIASPKVYDGTTDVTLNWSNATITGLCNSETLTIINAVGAFASKDCNFNKRVDITSIQFSNGENGGKVSNYTLSNEPIKTSAAIMVVSLTITATDVGEVNKVYDANSTAGKTFTYATGVGNETISLKASGAYNHKDVRNNAINGEMLLTFNVSNGNYLINSSVDGVSGKITPATLTVTAYPQEFVYGNTLDGVSYQINGWVNGTPEEDLNGSLSATGTYSSAGYLTAGTEHKTDGTNLVSSTGNYTIDFIDSVVTVNPLVLTHNVTVTTNKVYDGTTDAVFTGGLTNVLSGDAVTLNAKYDYDSKDVGAAKTISATTWNITGSDATNYTLPAAGTFSGSITEVPSVVVTTANDVVDPCDGLISLREAIAYADGNAAWGNIITFSDSIDWSTATINLTQGELKIDKDLTIQGSENGETIITINAGGKSRFFNVNNDEDDVCYVTLTALKLTGGQSSDNGGAILARECLTLENITVIDCNAANGGAIYNLEYGTIVVKDSSFSSNSATENGGAIYNNGYLSLYDSLLNGNSSANGGAVYNIGAFVVSDSSFTQNHSENGGAISTEARADDFVTATISNSYFVGNQATQFGGAIYTNNQLDGLLDIAVINSVIHSNSAKSCGGIYNTGANVKTTVVNSTVSLNSGLQIINNMGKLYLINDVVVGMPGTTDTEIYNVANLSLYGVVTGKIIGANTEWGLTTGAKAEDVFVSTDPAQTDLPIKTTGSAIMNGTLAGNILTIEPDMGNGDFYYLRDDGYWYQAEDETVTIPFDPNNEDRNYGLGSNDDTGAKKEVYENALNDNEYGTPVSRLLTMNHNFYNAGAYAIDAEPEEASSVVTTAADIIDPYDNLISLREAILYVGESGTILFRGGIDWNTTPILLTMGELLIDKSLTIQGYENNDTRITIDGGDKSRIFQIDDGNDNSISSVILTGLILKNGQADYGGTIYNHETMTIRNTSFFDNNADFGGAIYNLGTLVMNNTLFRDNVATNFGTALCNYGTVVVSNSTFTRQDQNSNPGAAIYNTGAVTVLDSTFVDTRANSGSALINETNGTATVMNSLLLGGSKDIQNSGTGSVSLYHVLYGSKSGTITEYACQSSVTIFDVFQLEGSDIVYDTDGIPVLSITGKAWKTGTLVGKIEPLVASAASDAVWYYVRDNAWWEVGKSTASGYTFDPKAENFGLGWEDLVGIVTTVFTTAQNRTETGEHVSRISRTDLFNVGAYATEFKKLTTPVITQLSAIEKSISVSWTVGDNEPATYDLHLYRDDTRDTLLYSRTGLSAADANLFVIDHLATGVSLTENTNYYLTIEAVPNEETVYLASSSAKDIYTLDTVAKPVITVNESETQAIHFSWNVKSGNVPDDRIYHWNIRVTRNILYGVEEVYNRNETDPTVATNYSVANLRAGEIYQVIVTAVVANDYQLTTVSATESVQIVTKCTTRMQPTPYDLHTICSTTDNSGQIDFSWLAIDGVTSYTVRIYENTATTSTLVYSKADVTGTHLTVKESNNPDYKFGQKLSQNKEYYLEISGNGIPDPLKGTASIQIGSLGAKVSSIWSEVATRPELTVSWAAVKNALSYNVTVYADKDCTQSVLTARNFTAGTTITFDSLRENESLAPGVEYWVKVEANMQNLESSYTLVTEPAIATKTAMAPTTISVITEPATNYVLDVDVLSNQYILTGDSHLIEKQDIPEGGILILGKSDRMESLTITEEASVKISRIYFNGNQSNASVNNDLLIIEGKSGDQTFSFDSVQSGIRFNGTEDSSYGTGTIAVTNGAVISYAGIKNVGITSNGNDTFNVNELDSNINLILTKNTSQTLDFSGVNANLSSGVVMSMDSTGHQAAVVGQSGTIRTNLPISTIILSSGTDTVVGSVNGTNFVDTSLSNNVVTLKGGDNSVLFNGTSTIVAVETTQNNVIHIDNADYSIINLSKSEGDNDITLIGTNVVVNGGKGNDTVHVSGDYALLNMTAGSGNDTIRVTGNNASITCGPGNDTVTLIGSNGYVSTGAGDDRIYIEDGTSVSSGNIINAGAGNDMVIAVYSSGINTYYSGAGNDFILGGSGADTIYGNSGNNFLFGSLGADKIFGGTGRDIIAANRTNNLDVILNDMTRAREQIYDDVYTLFGNLEKSWSENNDLSTTLTLSGTKDVADKQSDSLKRGGGNRNLFFETLADNDFDDAMEIDLVY